MYSISSLKTPFHTISINFILTLLRINPEGYNTVLTITDKFIKRITLAAESENYIAEQWTDAILNTITNWGLPKVIISDRDPKFIASFWKEIFEKLNTRILMTIAYHLQANS